MLKSWLPLGIMLTAPLYGAGQVLPEIALKLESDGPRAYELEGHFQVEASRQIVWDVLTDYGRMTKFVPSLRHSEILERRPHGVLLKQEAQGRAWMFSRTLHVLLDVTEKPLSQIGFEDVSHRDFAYYKGTWQMTDKGQELEVTYRLKTKRAFAAPNFLAQGALEKSARSLLADVRAEMIRRAEKKGP